MCVWKKLVTNHDFKNRSFIGNGVSWGDLSGAAVFGHPTAWREVGLSRSDRRPLCAHHLWCAQPGIRLFQQINLQQTFEPVFAHLNLEPLVMRLKGRSDYLHESGFFYSKPLTDRNLSNKNQTSYLWFQYRIREERRKGKRRMVYGYLEGIGKCI